jgi:hypothetical protein
LVSKFRVKYQKVLSHPRKSAPIFAVCRGLTWRPALYLRPPPTRRMAPSATFSNLPLSTSVNPLSQRSLISLDWILASGVKAHQSIASGVLTLPTGDTVCSMHMKLSVTPSLAYDLVLGRDWLFFCCETLPYASFHLSVGIVRPGQPPSGAHSHKITGLFYFNFFRSCSTSYYPNLCYGS